MSMPSSGRTPTTCGGAWRESASTWASRRWLALICLMRRSLVQAVDWYSVTLADLKEWGLRAISKTQLADLLEGMYPEHKWDRAWLIQGRRAQQRRLERAIASIFPVCARSSSCLTQN